MSKLMGWDLLTEQMIERVQADVEGSRGDAKGDSEIERLFFHALNMSASFGMTQHGGLVELPDAAHLYVDGSHDFFFERQAQLENWRVDFLFHAWNHYARGGPHKWHRLIVECDGHNFHERTKDQAAKDRSRDRWAVRNGFDIFRFTGSEIWRDPLGCAEQVHDWAGRFWS